MLISEFNSREEVLSVALKELKGIGIKVRSEKYKQIENKRRRNKKIFKVQLHALELDNGILSNGAVCQIPKFVLNACGKIQNENKTEGLFRKTGNVKKQRQIQEHLENGGGFEKQHNVIDIANLLKTFFRELPEPLIPGSIQDALIRCLINCTTYEHKTEAILMTCLFLPPITVNTLAYFLQFLEVITKNAAENFMTVDNLVKVLTPSIMPMPLNAPEKRLQSHFKIIELLIENANLIGVVPDRMIKKEEMIAPPMTEERKKKKRRSGSLNRVFNGFRKMVGAIGGSSENLDKSEEGLIDNNSGDFTTMTPNITKSVKKRRLEKFDIGAFSVKKKNIAMTTLQEIDDSPSSSAKVPYVVEKKKNERTSWGEKLEKQKVSPPKTRRWSLAPDNTLTRNKKKIVPMETNESNLEMIPSNENDYVRVHKSEYEAFKTRLNTIEIKINQEFNAAKLDAVKSEMSKSNMNGPEKVENKFNETLKEVEKFDDPKTTDMLAKRLSRDLKIRPKLDHATVTRSPSARKIGSLRRRRDSATRLSRGNSWHVSSTFDTAATKNAASENDSQSFHPMPNLKRLRMVSSSNSSNQAQSSTQSILQTIPQSIEKVIPEKPARKSVANTLLSSEIWTNATDFFKESKLGDEKEMPQTVEVFKTPVRPTRIQIKGDIDLNNTPMLPPRLTASANKRYTPINTPNERKMPQLNKTATPSTGDGREARASIIQIRNQNAGQVAQKAKLFDNLSSSELFLKSIERQVVKLPRVVINKNLENVKNQGNSSRYHQNQSPRRSSRSPGVNRRLQIRAASQQSPALKTIKENKSENRTIHLLQNAQVLQEIASPRKRNLENRKALSQNNTPRRSSSRTPRRKTPTSTKSPRCLTRRREISFD